MAPSTSSSPSSNLIQSSCHLSATLLLNVSLLIMSTYLSHSPFYVFTQSFSLPLRLVHPSTHSFPVMHPTSIFPRPVPAFELSHIAAYITVLWSHCRWQA
ncbi:hypothetical protein MSAN_00859700 [Mycena sanguinolenta]|uniref:Uncharacterized protein n=1 Tax=Mycena sanguinolenta TaxID=230812 RepID=A0A8H7DDW3_9AGAR|nr:hypothetical protein MSAN_00859700 [Mycena sanguinolenta]